MEFESKVLGKINKKKCYLNDGKYGFYLSYDAKNYKVPDWFPADKMAEQWMSDKVKKEEESDDDDGDGEIPKLEIKKKNK